MSRLRTPRTSPAFWILAAALAAVVALMAMAVAQSRDPYLGRARALQAESPLIDGHNDLVWEVRQNADRDFANLDISRPQPTRHTDIPRLRAGELGGQFWSVYVPATLAGDSAVSTTLEQIDLVYQMLDRYPDTFALALTADDVERIFRQKKIASIIALEGGHSMGNSLGTLRMFYRLGARSMTLTHSLNVAWADSANDAPAHDGLTRFGEEVVREMNRLGMIVDLAHVSDATMDDALRVSSAPVLFTHSNARALCDVPRNVPDEVLRKLPANGGVVMVSFVSGFTSARVATYNKMAADQAARLQSLHPDDPKAVQDGVASWRKAHAAPKATLAELVDHIDYIRKMAGIDYVGIGSDFDGTSTTPVGLEDVSHYPALTAELLRRGYSETDVKKVLGLNVLRVMREVENVAARLQSERGPSEATIEQLDGEGHSR
jgi:membrane dipeptidase